MDIPFLTDTLGQLLEVLPTTLKLFAAASLGGCLMATGLVWMRLCRITVLVRFARVYIFIFRGSPLMIQMFLVFYGVGQFELVRESLFWPAMRDPFFCALISLMLCTSGYTAEIFRGSVLAVPVQQIEAGRSCGMSGLLLLRRVIVPIALRQALPAYSTELVMIMKSTALASLVTVWEMTGVSQRIITNTFRTMEVFLCAAAIYLILNFIIVRLVGLLEYRLSPHLRALPGTPLPPPNLVK